jgi:diacylglycerol kinase (ATP)
LLAGLIDGGQTIRLDAGRANGKLFLVMASCGFDADVVARLHSKRKGHIRHWSYAKPIFNAISQYRYPTLRVWVDDDRKPISGKWAFVFNVPRYAMNLPIVEDADPMDEQLDLCMFRGGNLIRGLYYLLAVITRQHRRWREARVTRFRRIRIASDETVPFQLDGDPGGELPVEIQVQPQFLRVVVSKDWMDKNRS